MDTHDGFFIYNLNNDGMGFWMLEEPLPNGTRFILAIEASI
jgi:hypothetical protein